VAPFPSAPVLATPATCALMQVMLADALRIAEGCCSWRSPNGSQERGSAPGRSRNVQPMLSRSLQQLPVNCLSGEAVRQPVPVGDRRPSTWPGRASKGEFQGDVGGAGTLATGLARRCLDRLAHRAELGLSW
jgi:hypothetical protein